MLHERAPPNPAALFPFSCPRDCCSLMGKSWGAHGLGSVRACAQDVNWEESRSLACTAHGTAGFLSFKVVYVT